MPKRKARPEIPAAMKQQSVRRALLSDMKGYNVTLPIGMRIRVFVRLCSVLSLRVLSLHVTPSPIISGMQDRNCKKGERTRCPRERTIPHVFASQCNRIHQNALKFRLR